MIVRPGKIDGLFLLETKRFEDDRGFFAESFNQRKFEEIVGRKISFVQDNESLSRRMVLRGLHFQVPPFAQGKLVRVVRGSALDVAVDLRRGSPTYGQHEKHLLSSGNGLQFWIPEGFAHGFLALEDDTLFSYKCTEYYHPEAERSLLWNDKDLKISWGAGAPIISPKDAVAELFSIFVSPFE